MARIHRWSQVKDNQTSALIGGEFWTPLGPYKAESAWRSISVMSKKAGIYTGDGIRNIKFEYGYGPTGINGEKPLRANCLSVRTQGQREEGVKMDLE